MTVSNVMNLNQNRFENRPKTRREQAKMFQKYTVFKTETQHKTKKEIVDLIKSELGVVENDISVWNHMMQAISRISISEVAQSDGK